MKRDYTDFFEMIRNGEVSRADAAKQSGLSYGKFMTRFSEYCEDNGFERPGNFVKAKEETLEFKQTIKAAAYGEITYNEAAEKLGIKYNAVYDRVVKKRLENGITKPLLKNTSKVQMPEGAEKIVKLLSEGEITQQEASKKIGVSVNIIRRWLEEYCLENNVQPKRRGKVKEIKNLDQLAEKVLAGEMTQVEAAKICGTVLNTFRAGLRRYCLENNKELRIVRKNFGDAVQKVLNSEITLTEASELCGVSYGTVRRWIVRYCLENDIEYKNPMIIKLPEDFEEVAMRVAANKISKTKGAELVGMKWPTFNSRYTKYCAENGLL